MTVIVERPLVVTDGRPDVMSHLIKQLRKTEDPSDLKDAEAIEAMLTARIEDKRGRLRFPRPVELLLIDMEDENPLYQQAREVFSSAPLTPEIIAQTRRLLWQEWAPRAEIAEVSIPSFEERFVDMGKHRRFDYWMTHVPDPIAQDSNLLGKIFPKVKRALKNGTTSMFSGPTSNAYTHLSYAGGWYEVEGAFQAPYLNTKESDLPGIFARRDSVGQRLVTNVIASYENWVLRGHYFEEDRKWVRLTGSLLGGKVVMARCYGPLSIRDDYMPGSRSHEVGARSERLIPSLAA